jgi:hypothetical protein
MDFSKYLGEVGLTELWNLMTAYIDNKIFIGTKEEYEAAAANIPVGTMVVIIDESDIIIPPVVEEEEKPEIDTTIAILGAALLGKMKLGRS